MPLHHLPNELLLRIASLVLKCDTCDCHHVSHHLLSLVRCNHRLHFLLAPGLLRTACTLNILLWAVGNSRQDTVTLVINLGADPNLSLCETVCTFYPYNVILGTPVDIAVRMRIQLARTQPRSTTGSQLCRTCCRTATARATSLRMLISCRRTERRFKRRLRYGRRPSGSRGLEERSRRLNCLLFWSQECWRLM